MLKQCPCTTAEGTRDIKVPRDTQLSFTLTIVMKDPVGLGSACSLASLNYSNLHITQAIKSDHYG